MNLEELIKSRRTIQIFSNEKVADDVVYEALQLSLWAPNHRTTFPWIYLDVRGSARQQLAELSVELKSKKGEVPDAVRASIIEKLMAPSHLILLGVKRAEKAITDKENYATLACSVQIASLRLWEKGVGSKWTTSGFTTHQRTYEILGVSPDALMLEGALMIGMWKQIPAAVPRPSLEQVLRKV